MKVKSTLSCILVGGFLLIGGTALASDPQPTPKPKLEKNRKAKTLGDLAGSIKLGESGQGKDSSEKKSIVIDNKSLKKMGEGAVMSEGGSLAASGEGPVRRGEGEAADSENLDGEPGTREKAARTDEVEKLEAQLEAIKKAQEENKKANLYNGAGPQYRSPGTRDPLEIQKEEIEAQLAAAKKASSGAGQGTRRPSRKP